MVSGAQNIMFRSGKEPLQVNQGYNAYPAAKVGPNYSKYEGNQQPNYEQYDVYRSPVTSGRAGDKFDMKM